MYDTRDRAVQGTPDGQSRTIRHEKHPRDNKPDQQSESSRNFVSESRFGFWFLGTQTWEQHVVEAALDDLARLIETPRAAYPVVLDAGCGQGKAFRVLSEKFKPRQLIGVDADAHGLKYAHRTALSGKLPVTLVQGDCA
ncbi:Methyltransferase type 11, partial [mine drainage metagenome]